MPNCLENEAIKKAVLSSTAFYFNMAFVAQNVSKGMQVLSLCLHIVKFYGHFGLQLLGLCRRNFGKVFAA